MTTISTGSQVGPYEVEDLIARGGMGEVYRAHDTRLQRHVALKVLAPRLAADSDHLARFTQEARTTAGLNHPNIVALYDVGSYDGVPFVVSELLDGQTLRARMNDGPPPFPAAVEYGHEIARGLVAAHRRGVVHRDLKPENVFITRDNRVKILDFGLATCQDAPPEDASHGGSTASTTLAVVVGTVGYSSPEQVRGRAGDHRSDIFSLGIILYEMIAGVAPFRRDSTIETLHATLKEEPSALSPHNRQIPAQFDRIVRHCLEKSPDARFQSASDLAFSLEPFLRSSSSKDDRRSPRRVSFSRMAAILHLF